MKIYKTLHQQAQVAKDTIMTSASKLTPGSPRIDALTEDAALLQREDGLSA